MGSPSTLEISLTDSVINNHISHNAGRKLMIEIVSSKISIHLILYSQEICCCHVAMANVVLFNYFSAVFHSTCCTCSTIHAVLCFAGHFAVLYCETSHGSDNVNTSTVWTLQGR